MDGLMALLLGKYCGQYPLYPMCSILTGVYGFSWLTIWLSVLELVSVKGLHG